MTQPSDHPVPTSAPPPSAAPDLGTAERRNRVLRLAVAVAFAIVLAVVTGNFPTLAVIGAVVAMVMLHELGHFITAKRAGMKVTEYFLGFGPRLWSFRKGETEYGVKALPLGGYVRILGMNSLEQVDPADEPRTYRQQSYPKRMSVAVAGSAMHFLIAFVLLVVLWSVVGIPRYDHPEPVIGTISVGKQAGTLSPAQKAGFQIGDRILSIDQRPVKRWDDLPPYIQAHPGQEIEFLVRRKGEVMPIIATPTDANPQGQHVGFIGIGAKIPIQHAGPVAGVGRAGRDVGVLIGGSAKALGSFFTPGSLKSYSEQLTGNRAKAKPGGGGDNRLLSPVGLYRIAGQAADAGLFPVLYLLVLINVFVGVFNMVPLLPLDGGHVAIATYERIRSRRGRRYTVDAAKLLPVTAAVVAVLIVLGGTSLWLDIVKPLANPFH